VGTLTRQTEDALLSLVADFPDRPRPGTLGRWLTEVFNDWPEGRRPALGQGDAAGTDLESRDSPAAGMEPPLGGVASPPAG
jgi:hypothetical protein